MSTALKKVQFTKLAKAIASKDGHNASVFRIIGTPKLDVLDPFLMLDEFHVTKPGGFPDHPHRGFETVTYMMGGAFKHKDNAGHSGIIGPGDVQWMSAARGIVHSEMPATDGDNYGLQLWVNLAAKDKMGAPQYQEYKASELPKKDIGEGASITLIAGESHGITSPIQLKTPVLYVDITITQVGTIYNEIIPAGYQGFIYVHKGTLSYDDDKQTCTEKHLVAFDEDAEKRELTIKCKSSDLRFFIIAGKPLKEPVARYGPFVMNTQQEILQAFRDW
jgi:redox-sensitive bicupin YhaK (pirin superfamily)